ncbi:MAG: sortase B protein-sorting domain-containing protein [Dorea sp.]|nr:sortase B protein-sorting domain-containing protein [Coprococcus comes]
MKNPKTGDNSNIFLWIVLLLISGGTVSCIIVYDKKRKYNMK